MYTRVLTLTLIVVLLFVIFGCKSMADTPTVIKPTSSLPAADMHKQAMGVLNKLNAWDSDELDAAECPCWHPGRISTGETNAWIASLKQDLMTLGFVARWNHRKMIYELVLLGDRTVFPLCDCPQED